MPTLDELRAQALAVNERLKKAEEEEAKKARVYNSQELLAGTPEGESPDRLLPNLYNPDMEVRPKTGYLKGDVVRGPGGTKMVGESAQVFDVDTLIEKSGGGQPGSRERFMYELRKNPNFSPPPELRAKYTDKLPDYAKVPVEKVWRDQERTKAPAGSGVDKKENPEKGVASVPVVKRPGLPRASGLFTESKSDSKKPKKK